MVFFYRNLPFPQFFWGNGKFMGRSSLLSEVFFTWRRPHYLALAPIFCPWQQKLLFMYLRKMKINTKGLWIRRGATRKSSGIHRNEAIPKSQLSSQEHVRLMLFFGSRVRCFCMCSSFEHGFVCLGIALLGGQVLQGSFRGAATKSIQLCFGRSALLCQVQRSATPWVCAFIVIKSNR